MPGSKYLEPLLFLLIVAEAASHDHPPIKFTVSLDHNSSQFSGDLQRIYLHCGWKRDSSSMLSPLVGERNNQISVQESDAREGQFHIMVGGSEVSLMNYTDSVHENGNITATFYIPKQTRFDHEFTCGYNSSNSSSSLDLVFVYVPVHHETIFDDSTFRILFALFCCLFLVTLALLIIICGCVCYSQSKSISLSNEEDGGTLKSAPSLYEVNNEREIIISGHVQRPKGTSQARVEAQLEDGYPTVHCHHSGKKLQGSTVKGDQEVVEMETAQRSSQQIEYLADHDECVTDGAAGGPPTKALSVSDKVHIKTVLPRNYHDISYPKLWPNDEENMSYLEEGLLDPIEVIQLDSNGGRYSNENHEVYISFPKGFIPEGKTISIEIGVSFHSSLVTLLPLESIPISPLVKLCVVGEPSIRFLKPVEITLPHFLDITESEDVDHMGLQFMKSGHNLYCFHKSDGDAVFKPRISSATLKTNHFCTFCIAANENISSDKINYRLVKVVPQNKDKQEWKVDFCVSYYLRTCLEVCAST
jgi:hypothetical protein